MNTPIETPIEAPVEANVEQQDKQDQYLPLRDSVKQALENYFLHLDGQSVSNVYEMFIAEVESPLLEAIMKFTKGNQSKAARLLGISRGTLRKKLKIYDVS